MEIVIPFAEWLPDLPDFSNPGALTVKNVIPSANSYSPFKSLSVYSNALTARCQGAASFVDKDGNTFNFSGDATKLYKLSGATYSDVSGGAYSTPSDGGWKFCIFNGKAIATNFNNNIQAISLGAANFADLNASAPRARHIATVRDFVVVGNTFDGVDGNKPNRVRWCALGDETDWAVSATTQADYQDIEGDGGWVQEIIGTKERGVVFMERAIWLMSYVGTPTVFQFDQIETLRGCYAPGGVVTYGSSIFFLSGDGFYVLDSSGVQPIGANKVDQTFFDDLDSGYKDRISATVDPIKKVVMWAYPGAGNVSGRPNKVIVYNFVSKRWSIIEIELEILTRFLSTGYTLEGLDALYASIDSIPESLDSRSWTGGAVSVGAFNPDHKLSTFSGTALDFTIDTAETQIFASTPENPRSFRAEVVNSRPLVDGGTHSVQVGTRDKLADTYSWSLISSENSTGFCPLRSDAWFHRFRVTNTGDFTAAQGIEVSAFPSGTR